MLSVVLLLALFADPPRATINCSAIQFVDKPGLWTVQIRTEGFDGKKELRTIEQPFKSRPKALKACDHIVGQWENLYGPKKSKKLR